MITDRLLIISPYPRRGLTYGDQAGGVASFTKNKLSAMKMINPEMDFVVLADKIVGERSFVDDNGVRVKRVWRPNSWLTIPALMGEAIKQKDIKKVMVEAEWALFGSSIFLTGMIPLLVMLLRVFGKEVYLVAHGVLVDFSDLSPQLGIKTVSWTARVIGWGLGLWYFLLMVLATKVIVNEQYFADLLNNRFWSNKAIFIPHGVTAKLKMSRKATILRKRLGIERGQRILLNFGFLSWYKGTDLAIEAFGQIHKWNKRISLVVAGGESVAHRDNGVYRLFIERLRERAKLAEGIFLTGFVPERNIGEYFQMADYVLLPHRVFISSSGPMALAFAYGKPLFLSKALSKYQLSKDFAEAMEKADLAPSDLFFNLDGEGLLKALRKTKKNEVRLRRFARIMAAQRGWSHVAGKYLAILKN